MSDGPGILLDVFWVSRRLYLFDQLSLRGRRLAPRDKSSVRGFVYDVKSGELNEVSAG